MTPAEKELVEQLRLRARFVSSGIDQYEKPYDSTLDGQAADLIEAQAARIQELEADWQSLEPLVQAGAFDVDSIETCDQCGALLLLDEICSSDDFGGCWRAATGREKDPCPGDARKRISLMVKEAREKALADLRSRAMKSGGAP